MARNPPTQDRHISLQDGLSQNSKRTRRIVLVRSGGEHQKRVMHIFKLYIFLAQFAGCVTADVARLYFFPFSVLPPNITHPGLYCII